MTATAMTKATAMAMTAGLTISGAARRSFAMATAVAAVLVLLFLSGSAVAQPVPDDDGGRFHTLRATIHCPQDEATYGARSVYGYWGGGPWCGQNGPEGHWVYAAPNWYVWAGQRAPNANAGGRYDGLLATLNCPSDRGQYGSFHDFGYWGGGDWCGDRGPAGYWVYSYPDWHVWETDMASAGGGGAAERHDLVGYLVCPQDAATYGAEHDYGYWAGGEWCGQSGPAGYWVYREPTWYIYAREQ